MEGSKPGEPAPIQKKMAVTYDISKVKSMESHYDRHANKYENADVSAPVKSCKSAT